MNDEHSPSDDTLRLILAADQEEWLVGRINESRAFIWAMSIVLVVSALWGLTNYQKAFTYFDEPKCFVLIGDLADNQELLEQFAAEGLKPCPKTGSEQEQKDREITWRDVQAIITFASWLAVIVSALTLLRHTHQLRKFKIYLEDHRAFLAKYNRLPSTPES